MSNTFDATRGPILVKAVLLGPVRPVVLRLALDTGALGTLVSGPMLVSAGYDIDAEPNRVQMTTASGGLSVPRVSTIRLEALGRFRVHFPILAHALPPSVKYDGLLGLDFLRGLELTIDFRAGVVRLA